LNLSATSAANISFLSIHGFAFVLYVANAVIADSLSLAAIFFSFGGIVAGGVALFGFFGASAFGTSWTTSEDQVTSHCIATTRSLKFKDTSDCNNQVRSFDTIFGFGFVVIVLFHCQSMYMYATMSIRYAISSAFFQFNEGFTLIT
jgi:hypothetical protein